MPKAQASSSRTPTTRIHDYGEIWGDLNYHSGTLEIRIPHFNVDPISGLTIAGHPTLAVDYSISSSSCHFFHGIWELGYATLYPSTPLTLTTTT
jgi:hypothetical protein